MHITDNLYEASGINAMIDFDNSIFSFLNLKYTYSKVNYKVTNVGILS